MSYKIHRKGYMWELLDKLHPGISHCATTLLNHIFMPGWFYDETISAIRRYALLLHELEHVKQYEREGFTFVWNYLTDINKRKEYELEGYEQQIRYISNHGEDINVENFAYIMANIYGPLKWITVEEAKQYIIEWL